MRTSWKTSIGLVILVLACELAGPGAAGAAPASPRPAADPVVPSIDTVAGGPLASGQQPGTVAPVDGSLATAFRFPKVEWATSDADDDVIFSDSVLDRVFRVDRDTGALTTIAGSAANTSVYGGTGGPATAATLVDPTGVVVDGGDVWFAEKDQLAKIDGATGVLTRFAAPSALRVAVTDAGEIAWSSFSGIAKVFILDEGTGTSTKISGFLAPLYAPGGDGGSFIDGTYRTVNAMAWASDGDTYLLDQSATYGKSSVRRRDEATDKLSTVRSAIAAGSLFWTGLVVEPGGTLLVGRSDGTVSRYVADTGEIVEKVAGTVGPGYSGDGGPALEAQLPKWFRLGLAADGDVLVVDSLNGVVRRIDLNADEPPAWAPYASWGALVDGLYASITTKAPSPVARAAWVDQLEARTATPGTVADALRRGSENLSNVDPVVRIYRAFLGRAPDAGGLRFWIKRRRNVAPARTWSVTQIATDFTSSSEFKRKYGSLTNRQFVTRIYTDVLARTADPSGVNYWTGKLDRRERTRAQVMVGFSESSEYQRKQAENTDVAVAYLDLLGRAPLPAEAATWVARQKAATTHRDLLDEVLAGTEFGVAVAG